MMVCSFIDFPRIPMVHTSTSSYASIPHGKEALRSGGGREFPNLSLRDASRAGFDRHRSEIAEIYT